MLRGIPGSSQLHLSPDHFPQKVDFVRLGELTHRQIHLVNNLRIARKNAVELLPVQKPNRQQSNTNESRQYDTLHLFVLPFRQIRTKLDTRQKDFVPLPPHVVGHIVRTPIDTIPLNRGRPLS